MEGDAQRFAVANLRVHGRGDHDEEGSYYAPGKPVPPGERKLYLLIEGPTERCVQNGKQKLKETIEAEVNRQALPGGFTVGKYKV